MQNVTVQLIDITDCYSPSDTCLFLINSSSQVAYTTNTHTSAVSQKTNLLSSSQHLPDQTHHHSLHREMSNFRHTYINIHKTSSTW